MQKKMMALTAALFAVILIVPQARAGGDNPKELVPVKGQSSAEAYATGWEVGIFGGADAGQTGHARVTDSAIPGFSTTLGTDSQVGGAAGLHGGYTWSDLHFGTAKTVDGSFAILPSLEGEFLWTGVDYRGSGSLAGVGTSLKADLNAYTFTIDPKLKFQIGRFRPYIGFGLGGSYITADHGQAGFGAVGTFPLIGTADDFAFTVEGLAGVQTFVTTHVSVDVDYKFVDFIDDTLTGNGPIKYHSDSFGSHVVTAGVSYHF